MLPAVPPKPSTAVGLPSYSVPFEGAAEEPGLLADDEPAPARGGPMALGRRPSQLIARPAPPPGKPGLPPGLPPGVPPVGAPMLVIRTPPKAGASRRIMAVLILVVILAAGGIGFTFVIGRPFGAAPPVTAPPTVIPNQSQVAAASALAAFHNKVLVPGLSFHMTADGTFNSPSENNRWTGTFEVAGPNYHAVIRSAGKDALTDVYVIDRHAYVRNSKGTYGEASTQLAAWQWAPFLDIADIKDLDYMGTTVRDGVTYDVLQTNGWWMPDNGRMLNLPGVGSAGKKSLKLLVTDDGKPAFGTYTFSITGATDDVAGTTEFTFDKVGEPVKLKIPK